MNRVSIHVRDKCKEIVKLLNDKGFNGVAMWAAVEGSDKPEAGEQTVKQKAAWDKKYCSFIAEPEFDEIYDEGRPYVEVEINKDQFWKDFQAYLQGFFDKKTTIKIYKECNEIEVQRK
jgi:hypothetical protein